MSLRPFLRRAGPAAASASPASASLSCCRSSSVSLNLNSGFHSSPRSTHLTSSTAARRTLPSAAMPLKAKILNSGSQAQMSSVRQIIKELPGDDPQDVLFNNSFGLRSLELNRPGKLNSLNASMIRKIAPRLIEWEKSDLANVIVIKGAGDRALCAGGDVAALATQNAQGPEGQKQSADYFALEYQLDHLIATYRKPIVSFMDGITMGGGVGLSLHAPFRIATERTVFAMPETTIGLFPDVGASFFLPRLNGQLGTYLALTSDRVSGVDAFYTGIATHYLHSSSLPDLEARLAELRFKDYYSSDERLAILEATIEEFATGLPHDQPMTFAGEIREAIDRCFAHDSVQGILESLQNEAESGTGPAQSWAQKTIATLHERSPTSVHVTLRQMRSSRKWSIAETFQNEHHIASQFMKNQDFVEGVTARLISKEKPKPKPRWQPATLDDIPADSDITAPFFDMPRESEKLALLCDRDYNEYPHSQFGVPSEADVKELVDHGTFTTQDVHRKLVGSKNGRQGISKIVAEILKRKTITDDAGKALWIRNRVHEN